jgi:hypothetical protein
MKENDFGVDVGVLGLKSRRENRKQEGSYRLLERYCGADLP